MTTPSPHTGRDGPLGGASRALRRRGVVLVAAAAAAGAGLLTWGGLSAWHKLPPPTQASLAREVLAPLAEWRYGEPPAVTTGPVFPAEVRAATDAAALERAAAPLARGRPVTVTLANPPIVRSRYEFAWQDPSDPALDALIDRLGLAPFRQFPGDEFGMLRALTSHIRGRAPHVEDTAGTTLDGVRPGANDILDRVDQGGTLTCYYYSLLLVQALAALGYPARVVASGMDIRDWHATAEVFNHAHRKWVVADTDFDLVYVRDDVPLNAWELHDAFMAGYTRYRRETYAENAEDTQSRRTLWFAAHPEYYQDIHMLRGTVDAPRIPEHLAQTEGGILLGGYWTYSIALRNDYLSVRYPAGHPRATRELAMGDLGAGWLRKYDGELTNRPGDLYFTVDSVQLAFEPMPEQSAVLVHFDTYTPGFAGFRVQVDARPPADISAAALVWPVGPEGGRLRVWPVNARGVVGSLTEAAVVFGPPPENSALGAGSPPIAPPPVAPPPGG